MQNESIHVRESRLDGVPLIAAAFLVGAILGALLVVSFCAVLPEGGVMPSRTRFASLPPESAVAAPGRTEPVSSNWRTATEVRAEWPPSGQRGVREAGVAFGGGHEPQSRLWSPPSARSQQGLLLLTVTALGSCLIGATALIWSSHRANVRLEARIRRFEQLLSQHKAGWLDDLDSALEGEWQDRR